MDEIKLQAAGLELLLRAVRRLDGQLKRSLRRDRLNVTGSRWLPPGHALAHLAIDLVDTIPAHWGTGQPAQPRARPANVYSLRPAKRRSNA
jgi:hypothetical protein